MSIVHAKESFQCYVSPPLDLQNGRTRLSAALIVIPSGICSAFCYRALKGTSLSKIWTQDMEGAKELVIHQRYGFRLREKPSGDSFDHAKQAAIILHKVSKNCAEILLQKETNSCPK